MKKPFKYKCTIKMHTYVIITNTLTKEGLINGKCFKGFTE